jgi:hypothetical protein
MSSFLVSTRERNWSLSHRRLAHGPLPMMSVYGDVLAIPLPPTGDQKDRFSVRLADAAIAGCFHSLKKADDQGRPGRL